MRDKIVDYCKSLNIDTVGFIKCREFTELKEFFSRRQDLGLQNEFEEADIEKRINPLTYMEDGKTIISIAFPYFHNVEYVENGFSIYTRGYDYHRVVKSYLAKICEYIESLGARAIPFVDSNSLPERYIAYLANVGFIGKNNLIITKKYGSYVFLAEIITNLDIECKERDFKDIHKFIECKECDICYKKCPSKAINKNKKNCNICVSYFTQKRDLEDKELKLLNGRVFGCDSCQISCPYNKDVSYSKIEEFYPLDFMNEDNTIELINSSNKSFKETFFKTSCGWRGKNVLKRNAIIRVSKHQDIKKLKVDSSYLKEYIDKI